ARIGRRPERSAPPACAPGPGEGKVASERGRLAPAAHEGRDGEHGPHADGDEQADLGTQFLQLVLGDHVQHQGRGEAREHQHDEHADQTKRAAKAAGGRLTFLVHGRDPLVGGGQVSGRFRRGRPVAAPAGRNSPRTARCRAAPAPAARSPSAGRGSSPRAAPWPSPAPASRRRC
ncbi:MAG: hypothetical protein ACK56I_02530, partial [bacterium]